jgi:ferric-dicitrate binding protein FerR (iron transport regulator)
MVLGVSAIRGAVALQKLLDRAGRWITRCGIAFLAFTGVTLWGSGATLSPVEPPQGEVIGALVIAVQGKVRARPVSSSDVSGSAVPRLGVAALHREWRSISAGYSIPPGYEVVTGPDAQAELLLRGPARVHLGPTSSVVIEPRGYVSSVKREVRRPVLRVNVGTALIHLLKDAARMAQFEVETPTAVAGVRGTVFDVRVWASMTWCSVWEGQVEVAPRVRPGQPAVSVLVSPGEEVSVAADDGTPRFTGEPAAVERLWAPRQGWLKKQKEWEKKEQEKQQQKEQQKREGRSQDPPGKEAGEPEKQKQEKPNKPPDEKNPPSKSKDSGKNDAPGQKKTGPNHTPGKQGKGGREPNRQEGAPAKQKIMKPPPSAR